MSNARFSILQARAVKDKQISDAQFRTLAALGMYADEDGWCYPLLSTLGKDLGKSKQAVGRDTIALRKLGYLEVTPRYDKNGSRRSSLYRLKFDIPRQREVDTPSTSEVDTPSTSEVDINVPVNDPMKKDKGFAEIIKLYESNVEAITPLVATKLGYEFDAYYNEPDGPNWIPWAIEIAVSNNARNFNYIKKCLSNRKKHGKNWKPTNTNGVNHESRKTDNPPSPEQDASSRAIAAAILAERAARQQASV
jgi:DnaD/phage-associated family protein